MTNTLRAGATGSGNPAEAAASHVITTDGRELVMRRIAADDGDRLVTFHASLSPDTVYYRFFNCHPLLSAEEVERFTHVDGRDRVALVVLEGEAIVAVGRYDRLAGTSEAEVAFVVADAFQNHGLATLLLARLAEIARANGIETFVAVTLADNYRMRKVFEGAAHAMRAKFEGGVIHMAFRIVV